LLVGYGLSRSLLELFRFDLGRNFLFEESWGQLLSTSQAISIPIVLVGTVLLLRGRNAD
jgi:prolipoprotein diacylglyceryltransferase